MQASAPELRPTQPAGAQGKGDGALGAAGRPTLSPPLPPQALEQEPGAQIAQAVWIKQRRPHAMAEECAQLRRALLLPLALQPSPNPQGEPVPGD